MTNREIDALIAEKVMGLTPNANLGQHSDYEMVFSDGYRADNYSTDIAAAWQVVEKLVKDDYRMDVAYSEYLGADMGGADVTFVCKVGARGAFSGSSNTVSMAICKAALRAVGVDK